MHEFLLKEQMGNFIVLEFKIPERILCLCKPHADWLAEGVS